MTDKQAIIIAVGLIIGGFLAGGIYETTPNYVSMNKFTGVYKYD